MSSTSEEYSSEWCETGRFPWPFRHVELKFGETHDSSAAVEEMLRSGRPGSGLNLWFYRTFSPVHVENICRLIARSPELKSLSLYTEYGVKDVGLTAILNCLEEACPPLVILDFQQMPFHPDHLGLLGQFVAKAKHLQELSIVAVRIEMDSLRVFWDAVVKSESLSLVELNCKRASSEEFDFFADQLANQRVPNVLISMTFRLNDRDELSTVEALARLLKSNLILAHEIYFTKVSNDLLKTFSSTLGNNIIPVTCLNFHSCSLAGTFSVLEKICSTSLCILDPVRAQKKSWISGNTLSQWSTLEELAIWGGDVPVCDNEAVLIIREFKNHPSLRRLDLSGNGISIYGLEAILSELKETEVSHLDLQRNYLETLSTKIIDSISENYNLTRLVLDYNDPRVEAILARNVENQLRLSKMLLLFMLRDLENADIFPIAKMILSYVRCEEQH